MDSRIGTTARKVGKVAEESEQFGLIMNAKKMETMACCKKVEQRWLSRKEMEKN